MQGEGGAKESWVRNEYENHTLCGILRELMRSKGKKLKVENRHRTKIIFKHKYKLYQQAFQNTQPIIQANVVNKIKMSHLYCLIK